jgi:hypothetical protein
MARGWEGMKVWRLAVRAAACSGVIAAATSAGAIEQLPQYPIGVGTVYDSFYAPVPGLTGYLYNVNLSDPTFKSFSGNSQFNHFNLGVNAIAGRIVDVWDAEFLGARPITWVALPVAYMNGRIDLGAPIGTIGNSDWMLGDASIAQGLSWHFGPNWSASVALEVFLPTGPYSTNQTFNFGSNIYSFYPSAGVTYWNHGTNDTFTFKIQDIASTENVATHYQNGNAIEVEGGAGIGLERFGLNKNLGLDIAGFALVQTQGDSGAGALEMGALGQKSQLFGLGPQLRYNFEHGGLAVKWEHEFDARGLPQGERIWAQMAFPLFDGPAPSAPSTTPMFHK